MALDYAVAVNEEIRDLLHAGADIVQVDDPYLEAQPEGAREYGLKALERALAGVEDRTAVHVCFGYAAMVEGRPSAYDILPDLGKTSARQISIETAQSSLDCSVLGEMRTRSIILGVIDLSTPDVETPEVVAGRIRKALPYVDATRLVIAPDCGMKYLPRASAFGKLQAMVAGAAIVRRELE
jgi:5-methyltetrahydropteroyltriglutamate--homocysteine methyltransferase